MKGAVFSTGVHQEHLEFQSLVLTGIWGEDIEHPGIYIYD